MEILKARRFVRDMRTVAAVGLLLAGSVACGKRASAPTEPPKAAPTPYIVSGKAFALNRDGPVSAPQPLAPTTVDRIDHGRMKDLVVYRPAGEPRTVVLFLSGDNGWVQTADGGVPAMAQRLAAQGALVVGISTPDLIASFEANPTPCVYPDGDMVNLSHFVQAYYKMPTYHTPILVGYSSGASFAYAILAQMNVDTFSGLMTLGFGARLPMKKPMCPGTGFAAEPRDGGVDMKPSAAIGDPWYALSGDADTATPPAAARAFAARVPGSTFVALPKVGHDFANLPGWQPAFDEAYAKALGKSKVLLIGYSEGADVMPFAVNRLPQATRDRVTLVALMGLSVKAAFEFHMSNWVSAVDDGLPTQPEMEKLPASPPVLCLYGMDDDESLCPKLDPQRFKLVKLPGGHHFGGDYDRLADEILGAARH